MGVQAALGYDHKAGNPIHRAMRAIAASKPGALFFSKTIQPIDGAIHKLTGGKQTATELLAGLPVVYVTTKGRKSGELRRTPLIAVPIGADLALLGTNFGGKRTPGWVYNLEADPAAKAGYRTTEIDVVAPVPPPRTSSRQSSLRADRSTAATRNIGAASMGATSGCSSSKPPNAQPSVSTIARNRA